MSISFTINKNIFEVNPKDYPPDITLNTFIRNHANLSGTKFMCLEGGCGACIVTIRRKNPATKEHKGHATNSCLTLLNTCDECSITTIEGIGNKLKGYNPIQTRLAEQGGSQCGYCSPGMVMNMYSLVEARNGNLTATDIENSFGGNLCRCTGYRPILDAMKSFAKDSEFDYVDLRTDIEDLGRQCPRKGKVFPEVRKTTKYKMIFDDGHLWYYPTNLTQLFNALDEIGDRKYILVGGNTGHGVYRRDESIRTFIDTNNVQELHTTLVQDQIELGGNVTLTEAMDFFNAVSSRFGFEYCAKLASHFDKIANVPVRNMGTIAGNLMLKHEHREFPSDIVLLFNAIGASIKIATTPEEIIDLNIKEFLNHDMEKCVIVKIVLPAIDPNDNFFDTYKITIRKQNAHAYVNAAFLVKTAHNKILQSILCFGGINPEFLEATATSQFMQGKSWIDNEVLQQAITVLSVELKPDWVLPDASPQYRKLLACGLFYKFVLKNAPPNTVPPQYESGGFLITRPLSSGTQVYSTKTEKWPLTKPIPKESALHQAAGVAIYMNDLPPLPGQLWGAFVEAKEVNSIVIGIDPSEALRMKGVIAFYSAKDIPGKNSFMVIGRFLIVEDEEIFCSDRVKFHSQPIGIIVAETLELAKSASANVKIIYEKSNKNVVQTLQQMVQQQHEKDILYNTGEKLQSGLVLSNDTEDSFEQIKFIKGRIEVRSQYQFSLETQATVCIPDEDELNVFCSTQYMDLVQSAMATALNIPQNKINLEVRRVGGSYGAKVTRAGQIAIACALAATKLNRPVRFVQSLESNMAAVGKRVGCVFEYSTSIDNKGVILTLKNIFYRDIGCSRNDDPISFTKDSIPNCYGSIGWVTSGHSILTDAPSNTWCRGPGHLQGIAFIEHVMEHIAREVNRDPVDVRFDNIPSDSKMKTLLPEFVSSTSYRSRKKDIDNFNKENRWRKKGIAISLMKYPIAYLASYPATVAVLHHDGTVVISHGGIEMGQGLHMKVAQVAAYILGIPLNMVSIKPSTTLNGANSNETVAGIGSESVCAAVKGACEIILSRLQVVKDRMRNPTWLEIVKAAHAMNVNLIANYKNQVGSLKNYDVWGLACTDVEVDILTGTVQLNRVDILEDTGESMNPLIDCGQVEGAFIMGIGLWLYEHLVYDRQTGELKTNRTWNYKVPGAKDIPVDFRITLDQRQSNPNGFLGSKSAGEPAICLSVGCIFAIRHALDSARRDANLDNWYEIETPATPESVLLTAGHDESQLKL